MHINPGKIQGRKDLEKIILLCSKKKETQKSGFEDFTVDLRLNRCSKSIQIACVLKSNIAC